MQKDKKTSGSKGATRRASVRREAARGIRHARDRILVASYMAPNPWLREEMDARGWRPMDLRTYLRFSRLPDGVVPKGALVDVEPQSEVVAQLHQMGCPVVLISGLAHPNDAGVFNVAADYVAEGRLAAEHFFDRGFRYVAGCGRDPWGDFRLFFEGFRERAEALGMTCHLYRSKQTLRGESQEARAERRRHEFIEWVQQSPKPLGMVLPGVQASAMGCAWALDGGLLVPEDVAILSSHGTEADRPICETSMPTISTVDADEKRQMHAACGLLERLMAGEPISKEQILIPSKGVTERESTNLLATPDRTVALALRYMWDHLVADLSVDDAARVVGISSRQLARRFQRALNRTFSEELLRKRLVEMKRLLRSTDYAIADLAPIVGFRTDAYLYRTFRAAFGMTPSQYRRSRR